MTTTLPAADGAPFRTVPPPPASPLVQGRVAFGLVRTMSEEVLDRRVPRERGQQVHRELIRLLVHGADLTSAYRMLRERTPYGRAAVALVPTDVALLAVLADPPSTPVFLELPFDVLAAHDSTSDDSALAVLQDVRAWTPPETILGFGLTMPIPLEQFTDREWLLHIVTADLRRALHYVYWPAMTDGARATAFATATEAILLHGVSPDELPFDRSGRLGTARAIRSVVTRPIIAAAPYDLATAPLRWLERTPGIGIVAAARLQSYRDAHRRLTDDVLLAVGVDLRRAEPWMERPEFAHRRPPTRGWIE